MTTPSRHLPTRRQRQCGAIRLHWVGLFFMLVAGLGWTAMMSMRLDRNLFAEGAGKAAKVVETSGVSRVLDPAAEVAVAGGGEMRRCLIEGKTVVSNTDCSDHNPTTRAIKIQVTRGVEAPPAAAPAAAAPAGQQKLVDKWIEKQSL